jgi:protein-S-isoprenylcysteine O-methyltransferase Ste14
MTEDIQMILTISTIWSIFWLYGYYGGQKENSLEKNSKLLYATSTLLITIFFFYIISYNKFTAIDLPQNQLVDIFGYLLLILGLFFLLSSRLALSKLSFYDIMFAKNNNFVSSGIYYLCNHPMYYGIFAIIISSWIFFPTYLGLLLVIIMLLVTFYKIKNE